MKLVILEEDLEVRQRINIENKQIPKRYLHEQKMRITTAHNIFKEFFWYLAVLVSNSKKKSVYKSLIWSKNGNFCILSLFCRPFLLP